MASLCLLSFPPLLSLLLLSLLSLLSLLLSPSLAQPAIWPQNLQNPQKTGVVSSLLFQPPSDDQTPLFPGLQFTYDSDAGWREIRVNGQGKVVLIDELDHCQTYDPISGALEECDYVGKFVALGDDSLLYMAGSYRLRRYNNDNLEWTMESLDILEIDSVDSKQRPITLGRAICLGAGTSASFLQCFPSSLQYPFLALSPDESTIYYQSDLFTLSAYVLETNEFLWNHTFSSVIEAIKTTTGGIIIVDTFIALNLLNTTGHVVNSFGATSYILTHLVYEDRILINRDGVISAHPFQAPFDPLYTLEGTYDFVTPACGAADVFFLASKSEIRSFSKDDGRELWRFRLEKQVGKLVIGGNGTLYVGSETTFLHVALTSEDPQKPEPFPLWFLGWIIPLILLFLAFIYFIYRLNRPKAGADYEPIQ